MADRRAEIGEELREPPRGELGEQLHLWVDAGGSAEEFVLDKMALNRIGMGDAVRHLLDAGLLEDRGKTHSQLIVTAAGRRVLLDLVRLAGVILLTERSQELPTYDPRERVLCWRGQRVKQLRRDAPVQELVLRAFQRQGWPRWIEDPLPDEPGLGPKERLRETVKGLNRGLKRDTIRFHADGTGRGVRWEISSEAAVVAGAGNT